jgi:hypothetical protein
MDLSLIGKYGECVFDTFVDRLTASSITIHAAWLRPADNPFSEKKDITDIFLQILGFRGGVSLFEERMSPRDLLADGDRPSKRASGWGWGWGFWWRTPKRSASAAIQEGPDKPHWLCVEFSVPGNVKFTACYRIPDEPVTFPPSSTDPRRMTPIDKQIISAAIVDITDDEYDEEQPVLLDFTSWMRSMAGPNGDFFGRSSIDIRLAIAETLVGKRTQSFLYSFLDHIVAGKKAATILGYANDSEITVNVRDFACSAPPPPENIPDQLGIKK